MAGRHVLLVPAGADPDRVRVLAEHLVARGIEVVVPWANGPPSFEDSSESSVVVLAFGRAGPPQELGYPLDTDARLGRLLAVRLESASELPRSEPSRGTIDLADWSGGDSPELDRLIGYVRVLMEHDRTHPHQTYALDDMWVVDNVQTGNHGDRGIDCPSGGGGGSAR